MSIPSGQAANAEICALCVVQVEAFAVMRATLDDDARVPLQPSVLRAVVQANDMAPSERKQDFVCVRNWEARFGSV
jgi:hypothetical protein